jgi:hypothetical protein
LGRHPLELGDRRILVNRQMCSGAGRSLQVRLQYGRAAIWRNFFQVHLLAPAMT